MIRLLLDQGLPRRCASDLRELGWDVVHVGALGMATATDEEILDLALRQSRVVVTLDSDFAKILAARHSTQPSVIHIRVDRLKRDAMTQLLEHLIVQLEGDLARGVVAAVTKSGTRVRSLPLP